MSNNVPDPIKQLTELVKQSMEELKANQNKLESRFKNLEDTISKLPSAGGLTQPEKEISESFTALVNTNLPKKPTAET